MLKLVAEVGMTAERGLWRWVGLALVLSGGLGVGGCGTKNGPRPVSGATFEAAAFDEATWD